MKRILTLIAMIVFMESFAQPVNDEPCGAVSVPVTSGICTPATVYSWAAATSSITTPAPGCTWNSGKKDVWYKFTVPANGNVVINTDVAALGNDFTMAVYSAPVCSGSFTYLGCNDDDGPGNMPLISLTSLSAGTTYYIRLWDFTATNADGQVKMCISFTEPLSTSKVGVGSTLPATTLDVNGDITIRGGSPADGKVLTSDNNGKAGWESLPNGPGTKRKLSIPFTAFRPEFPGVDLRISTISGGWVYYDNGTSVNARMFAPVMLPDSVRMTKMTLYFTDYSATVNIEATIDVIQYNPPSVSYGTVAGSLLAPTGAADPGLVNSQVISSAISTIIKNLGQAYIVRIRNASGLPWPGADVKIGMVEIEYEVL